MGDQGSMLREHLKVAAPVFDKSTEEGFQFRIYRLGSLEVRTTQEIQRDEIIGAVFSICSATLKACMNGPLPPDWEQQKIIKASSFVESTSLHGNVDSSVLRCKYYLVLETDSGGKIVTERLQNGNLSWVENPEDLAERNSLAKSIRAETCSIGGPNWLPTIPRSLPSGMSSWRLPAQQAQSVTIDPHTTERSLRHFQTPADWIRR